MNNIKFSLTFLFGALTGILMGNIELPNPLLDMCFGILVYIILFMITRFIVEQIK